MPRTSRTPAQISRYLNSQDKRSGLLHRRGISSFRCEHESRTHPGVRRAQTSMAEFVGLSACTDAGNVSGRTIASVSLRRRCGGMREVAASQARTLQSLRPPRHPGLYRLRGHSGRPDAPLDTAIENCEVGVASIKGFFSTLSEATRQYRLGHK